ncbi:MAG: Uma2 family endonuclease [Austwickia sp.]|nr:MAG: Uma2 family endonuclease [Austwickia sp.]
MTTAPARYLTIDEFYRDYSDRETERWELVAGVPVMSPSESANNRATVFTVAYHLRTQLGTAYRFEPDSDVILPPTGGRDTVRMPDLLVRRRIPGHTPPHGDLTDVVLVVEIVSPGSVRTDRVAKRREYAAAGIPSYLVVDVRGDVPTLTLYDNVTSDPAGSGGSGRHTGRYAEPRGDGSTVTLHVDGVPVTLTATDLADAL